MSKSQLLRRAVRAQDLSLCWITRIVGMVLAAAGLIFLNQDIFSSKLSQGFFIVCIALGALIVVSSFLPSPRKLHLRELRDRAMLAPVMQRVMTRRQS